jgi:predicted DNA-binding WGR domain protein
MRRFEFVEGSSSKFWVPELQGSTFIVTYGRIGTAGQRKEKAFPDEESARREYERKVAEKVREGYQEVTAGGEAPAPTPASASEKKKAPAPKLELPPRVRSARPTAEQVAAAVQALAALEARLGKRSWQVTLQAQRARRVLRGLGGIDPAAHASLAPVFESLMSRVVAPKGQRLPLRLAMMLLAQVDVAAFVRATQQWKRAPAEEGAAAVAREAEAVGEPELALRMGVLLTERTDLRGSSEVGWQQRWSLLKPHVEAHLQRKGGGTLAAFLKSLDLGGDTHLTQRAARMGA